MTELHPLEAAMLACRDEAFDAEGEKIYLVHNMADVGEIRSQLQFLCDIYRMGTSWPHPRGEETFARNLALVANLLHEWLRRNRSETNA